MSRRIGITGNIGAGKTTVCRQFEQLGIPVYYADVRAKELMYTNQALSANIRREFGEESYLPDGKLNREHLARVAFGDPSALELLNSLVHPAVAEDALRWHRAQTDVPYTLHEAAILLEIGGAAAYDAMVVVSCPLEIRRNRVMARDGIDAEAFSQRTARQWTDERKEAAADYLIVNDGRHLLLPQVLRLDRILREPTAPKSRNGR